jgi:hypothetical protein
MWGWPAADMTYEFDRKDLARREDEIAAHVSFNYAVLDNRWVVDREAGGELERAPDQLVPRWLGDRWSFRAVHHAP